MLNICIFLFCLARNTLQKQQSLPVRPVIPLVARISDQNASGAPPMTVREKTRLDKFKQLLASPNTDLGKSENKQLEICDSIKRKTRDKVCFQQNYKSGHLRVTCVRY